MDSLKEAYAARLQWGGSADSKDTKPTHIASYEGILNAAMRPRWVRAALVCKGHEPVYTEWVEAIG